MSADVDTVREALDYLHGRADSYDVSLTGRSLIETSGQLLDALAALDRLAAAEALQQAEERASRRAHSMWRTESERADAAEAQRDTLAEAAQAVVDAADRKKAAWASGQHSSITSWIPSEEAVDKCRAALAAVAPTEAKP